MQCGRPCLLELVAGGQKVHKALKVELDTHAKMKHSKTQKTIEDRCAEDMRWQYNLLQNKMYRPEQCYSQLNTFLHCASEVTRKDAACMLPRHINSTRSTQSALEF